MNPKRSDLPAGRIERGLQSLDLTLYPEEL